MCLIVYGVGSMTVWSCVELISSKCSQWDQERPKQGRRGPSLFSKRREKPLVPIIAFSNYSILVCTFISSDVLVNL